MKQQPSLAQHKKDSRLIKTLFITLFPSLIIAGDYGSFTVNVVLKSALIFYQYVVLKSFITEYYKLIE